MRKITDTQRLDWLDRSHNSNGIRWNSDAIFKEDEVWLTRKGMSGTFRRRHKSLRDAIDSRIRQEKRKPEKTRGGSSVQSKIA